MPWISVPDAPITRLPAAPDQPALRIFEGKPHALTFLADGALVIGSSRGLRCYDAQTGQPTAALIEAGGVRWMVPHPDGVSVLVDVLSRGVHAMLRVWPAERRVVTLFGADFGYGFSGGVSPDGAIIAWRESGEAPMLHVHDTETGAALRAPLALPREANRASAVGVRADGVLYLAGGKMLLVHPDGRIETRDDSPFFMAPQPLLIEEDGSIIGEGGDRIAFDGKIFTHASSLPGSRGDWAYSHDRALLTSLSTLDEVTVCERASGQRVFRAELGPRASGQIPNWQGQDAAASAAHVAAIYHGDASVRCWRREDPSAPCAVITTFSQGAQALMFHGASLTVRTCQPTNTLPSVREIALDSGATRQLDMGHLADVIRTADAQHMLVLKDGGFSRPSEVFGIDDAGEVMPDPIEVQRSAERLALSSDGTTWGAISHTFSMRSDPTNFIQWREFGAARWAKTLKLKGYGPSLALGKQAAIACAGTEGQVVTMPKGKALHALALPRGGRTCAVSPDSTRGVILAYEHPLILHIASGALSPAPADLPGEQRPTSVCFQDDDTYFVGHDGGAITRHHAIGGAQTGAWFAHTDEVCALVWHDGHLWSASRDGTILQWGPLG